MITRLAGMPCWHAWLAHLLADRRFAAAWLEGSFGRNEADRVSDLDLHVAVAGAGSQTLCFHPQPRNAGAAAPQRLALISSFGRPAVIHENHYNAPEVALSVLCCMPQRP